jgi:hypothetical protein
MHLVSCWMSTGQAVLRKSSATVAADRICWSAMQQRDIAAEMERARVDFHHLLDNATSAELRARTNGTKWTNEQLLFHMLFGYLLVHNLLILVKYLDASQGLRGHPGCCHQTVPRRQLPRLARRCPPPRSRTHGASHGFRDRPAATVCNCRQ